MVKITLSNYNQQSSNKKAIIDIDAGTCLINDVEIMDTISFLTNFDFEHPLLSQPQCALQETLYVYEYDDFDGLLDAAKYVYATLIRSINPKDFQFKIAPTPAYIRLKTDYKIPFSIDATKIAREVITTAQLNSIVSDFKGYDFQYQDCLVLDTIMTLSDLPSEINADLLYQTNQDITNFCKEPEQINNYEIRYINRSMGFGVFARAPIRKGDHIALYCGVKSLPKKSGDRSCVFTGKEDGFDLHVDARAYGSLARFINHAPETLNLTKDQLRTWGKQVLTANVEVTSYNLYGIIVIIYSAREDIAPEEPLLVNYGTKYYNDTCPEILIKRNGNLVDFKNKTIKDTPEKRRHALKIMASHGVQRANRLLIRKPLFLFLVVLLGSFFNWYCTN